MSFGSVTVLDQLSLRATPGRVYVLLGPNGAGKSTTVRVALGLLSPDSGSVSLFGRPWQRAALSHVGASVDGPALYSHLSATENLLVHARLLGCTSEAVRSALDTAGLGSSGRKKVRRFSTGMKARLSLAIALLGDPELLLLDEPQNGLDPDGIVELRELIRGLAGRGRAVVVSSHQLGEVARLADDVGVLANGKLVFEGPIGDFAPTGNLEQAYFAATRALTR